jgi:hypothetical protein
MKGKPRGLLLLAVVALLVVAAAVPAYAQLTAVSTQDPNAPNGGIDPDTGFPIWYQDNNGTKLKLCVDSDMCLGGDPRPDPTQPASVATGNLPDEAFYAVARAETTLNGGGRIRWRAVLEGAFANEAVIDGDQVTFTRVQVTGSKIPLSIYPAGTTLTFQTPYGTLSAPVSSKGTLDRTRTESNPGDPLDGFVGPVNETGTGFGPSFLTWNTFGAGTDPALKDPATGKADAFIGDPLVLHAIKGGDNGVNSFRVLRNGNPVSPLETKFEIAGQVAQ